MNTYDLFGWYSAESYPDRVAPVAPSNTSLTTTPGELRANWTGHEWVDLPYVHYSAPAPVIPVPEKVTRRQGKQALLLAGLLDSVQPAIDAIPDATQRKLMNIEWNDSQDFERHRPSLIALATGLGLNSQQLDALFIQAATL